MTPLFWRAGEESNMFSRNTYALIPVAVVAASLFMAPTAGAMPTCQDAGSHVRCESSGSVSIKAVPQTRAPHVGEITPDRRRRGIVWSW
jgi:hypothetical protein